ncbi:PAS domain-containing protein [Mameliella sediminis]|uniref:PAS domain-containing protein n=1 Tax=Mameliella sediminis TaxID=2836866 RepID=UPI001C494AD6|nr:PAS domain-containing protein [Mameliella sediminis]MBV7393296.1 PAS domain-containing protein [Mameliella sediminis]MBY6161305.1 PAS domain-containing protein [Mameliella alba]MBY6169775.1 PAS domain-containing protein [Mameliella alba]MBY6174794.1 PAS domain-containing protein [Mameliella alba]
MLGKGGSDKDVVSMTDREKMRRLAPLRQVEAYWHGLCARDAVPLRSQIDPRGMEDALENAFLMERIAPTMAKIRVAGTHLNDLMGMQIAGMPLSCLVAPSDRERFGEAVAHLFADPAIIRIDLVAEGGFGKPDMEAHMILLPLRSDFGDQTRALGALISHGRIGRTPRRFTLRNVEVTPALGGAADFTSDAPARPAPTPALQEPAAPYQPRPAEDLQSTAAPATHGHLRLVVSND